MTSENLALTPILNKITSAQLCKSDLLELVEAEEEARLTTERNALKSEFALLKIEEGALKQKVSESALADVKKRFSKAAALLGATVQKIKTDYCQYDTWRQYGFCNDDHNGETLSVKPTMIFRVEAVCKGSDKTLRLDMEANIGRNTRIEEIIARKADINGRIQEIEQELDTLKTRMKHISAGITRKALESSDSGKQILSLLTKLRNSVISSPKKKVSSVTGLPIDDDDKG